MSAARRRLAFDDADARRRHDAILSGLDAVDGDSGALTEAMRVAHWAGGPATPVRR